MFNWLKAFLNLGFPVELPPVPVEQERNRADVFTTDLFEPISEMDLLDRVNGRTFQKTIHDYAIAVPEGGEAMKVAMDNNIQQVKSMFAVNQQGVPAMQLGWYGGFGFIGYQTCAMIAQHWLVDKACTMPARDALRKGFEVTLNDGEDIDPKVRDAMRKGDIKYRLNHHLTQFVRKGRIFGIRIAMFKIKDKDASYYEKPFNLDGITPDSYLGIVQIDPYWITPILDAESASNPGSLHFYEPTYWQLNGMKIHRSHLVIMRTDEVTDLLKPTYMYGGVSVPQKIYERVYAAERTANEAPLLALTKRSTVIHVDLAQALARQDKFEQRIAQWSYMLNNYGIKLLGEKEAAEQFDTSLADLDTVIMTQYQIVAAAANVPAVKLLGTTPKGFNATGEFEESSYHEELESIQTHDMTPLIERHHAIMIRSEIAPKLGIESFESSVTWKPLDSLRTKEKAEVNKARADTGLILVQAGAISPAEERQRLIDDPDSGYNGLESADLDNEEFKEDPDNSSGDPKTTEPELKLPQDPSEFESA